MNNKIDLILSILFVDDCVLKTERVLAFLKETVPTSIISVVKDQISAQRKLEAEKYDLLILDMQIPYRFGETENQEDGGILLLEELEFGEGYIHPSRIVVFTQYENLQKKLREKNPEIGAIHYDLSSNNWKTILLRTLVSLAKSKKTNKKIVYCEGDNVDYYNSIGLNGIEFWALRDSRSIYFAAKNEKDKFSLRDRDFLTSNEIKTLTNPPYFENYFILDYYCFENYLYHPDNISELLDNFDKKEYVEELERQKNFKIDSIIQDYKLARLGYTDFIDNDKQNMDSNPEDEIIPSIKSNNFETFYRYFDMAGKKDKGNKKSFNKSYLSEYNLNKDSLVKTKWFKMKIISVLNKIVEE